MPDCNPASNSPPPDQLLQAGRIPVLAVVPMPPDSNPQGNVFGGWIMSQIDIAGAVAAVQRARGRVSTVAANTITFLAPIHVGERVLFFADVVRVGTTSITVRVEVFSENRIQAPSLSRTKVSEGTLTYVALDANGRPRPVDEPPDGQTIRI